MEIAKASHQIVPTPAPTKQEVVAQLRDRNRKFMEKIAMFPIPEFSSKVFDEEQVVYNEYLSEEVQRYRLFKQIVAAYKNKGYSQRAARDVANKHANDVLARAKARFKPEVELNIETTYIHAKPNPNRKSWELTVENEESKPKKRARKSSKKSE